MNEKPSRELTSAERRAIRKLVVSTCANYDREYGCLPLDSSCYMLDKWWTGAYCKYFQNIVLPQDVELEASLKDVDISTRMKPCPICGKTYMPITSQAYCSDKCRLEGRRAAYRKSKKRVKG